jgi:hypothetical protein
VGEPKTAEYTVPKEKNDSRIIINDDWNQTQVGTLAWIGTTLSSRPLRHVEESKISLDTPKIYVTSEKE